MSDKQTDDITTLRATLFETLKALGDKDKPMEIDRAKAINEVAQTIINSAKVEVDALRVIGGTGSGFIPATFTLPAPTNKVVTQNPPGVTTHRLRG